MVQLKSFLMKDKGLPTYLTARTVAADGLDGKSR